MYSKLNTHIPFSVGEHALTKIDARSFTPAQIARVFTAPGGSIQTPVLTPDGRQKDPS
ncbi:MULTISPECIES: hypothetical protein [Yersinia]|uniref:hypothetical protein n=1 Tax=Yersinia TaxID=629 RepID=UPI0016437C46|nr:MULTISPECIES: hypothetical protein [Yersinia]MCB5311915.1 hypothetical protein [Yersinia intermedia]MCB5325360.1 hypothetical protein [Yersinia intermedia]